MITKTDITQLISEAYKKASLDEKCDMRLAADLFETVRENLDLSDPYQAWEFIILDGLKFDNDYTLSLLLDLRESYFLLFFERLLTHLDGKYRTSKKEGLTEWTRLYAEAAVNYRNDLLSMLCHLKSRWGDQDALAGRYARLPVYIRENRWPEAFPFFAEIAANKDLKPDIRAYAEMSMMEIILYYYHEFSGAKTHLDNAGKLLPGHFLTRRAEAIHELKTGNIQKARDGFMQVLSVNPADYCSVYFIGDCFMAEEKLENAEYWYKEAIKKNCLPNSSISRLLNLYGHKSWFKEKEPLLGGLIAKIEKRREIRNPGILIEKNLATEDCFTDLGLYQCYIDVATCWVGVENFEKAEEWFLKAKDLQPGIVPAVLNLAYVKLDQKQPEKALEYFMQAIGLDPDCFDAHLGLALFYKDNGNKEEALRYFNECLRLLPERSDWVNNFIGNLYYYNKEYAESEIYYRKAIGLNGNYPVYRQNLAGSVQSRADQAAEESRFEEAGKLYLEAVEIDDDADRWNAAGNFYFKLERWQQAAECFEKAVNRRNTDPVLHENLGLALQNLGKYDEAEKLFIQAIPYDEQTGRYFNRLGLLYYARNNYGQALEFFGKAAEREPDTAVYYSNMASASYEIKKYDQAVQYYEKALQLDPDNYLTYNDIGIICFELGRNDEAIGYYSKAISLKPDDAVLYYNLALALHTMGKAGEAAGITSHPLLTNEETRKQLEEMIKQNLPILFNPQES